MDIETRPDTPASFFYVLQEAVRILFVDDDPIMREFAAVHLSTDQADVTVAADGLEALQALAGTTSPPSTGPSRRAPRPSWPSRSTGGF